MDRVKIIITPEHMAATRDLYGTIAELQQEIRNLNADVTVFRRQRDTSERLMYDEKLKVTKLEDARQDLETRIKFLRSATAVALGACHCIDAAANSMLNHFDQYVREFPDEMKKELEHIRELRMEAHDALAADGRIKTAEQMLENTHE